MTDREEVLARVREATADVPLGESVSWSPETDRDSAAAYRRSSHLDQEALTALFVERCGEYRANVVACTAEPKALAAAILAAAAHHGATRLALPPDVPMSWMPGGITWGVDKRAVQQVDFATADGAVTGCALAIADTGTIVLDAGAGQGRRALSLLPDLHICIVNADQIVAGVPEAFTALAPSITAGRPITFISGPSATSDIELRRVEGVHGPRQLEVIVAVPEP